MKRRTLLTALLSSASLFTIYSSQIQAKALESPVTTNRLRPPGAVPEEIFPAKCIRCGRCVEVCPYRSIRMLDIRNGVHAGTPLIEAELVPCYLCMKCVDVCPTGSLKRVGQEDTRMGLAVVDKFSCAAWIGTTLCRTCYDKCPFPEKAIKLDQLKPVVEIDHCTGCGLCTNACPVTLESGMKSINIEPIYASDKVTL
ncbi:MAG: 4Fe-4S dicluster domain-containing protein [Desulfocapsaceae bacterium]